MSYSSLWAMNNKYEGFEIKDFSNSWWFSPIAWNVLFEKYLPEKMYHPYIGKMVYMTAVEFDKSVYSSLNNRINKCTSNADRVCWEMSNQQIFFTKDKQFVSNAILQFVGDNARYYDKVLTKDHIKNRFIEIANFILELDENKHPYFIFKNTSCDDNVEWWFSNYNEEQGEYENINLSQQREFVAEFVIIENNKIDRFVSNLDYFKERR
jgi:hypothetical protein